MVLHKKSALIHNYRKTFPPVLETSEGSNPFGSNSIAKTCVVDHSSYSEQHKNTEIMLQRLHTLDILQYPRFISILPHTITHLQSLKVCIVNKKSLQRLMTILENCGRSLHTLVISTCGGYNHLDHTLFKLDEIVERVPNLKVFGFSYESRRPLNINSLPSQLEELQVSATNGRLLPFGAAHDRNLERESEGFRVPTLKKFRMDFDVLDCYMLKILMANKDTLEELVLCKDVTDTEKAMVMLQEKHIRMEKVVNLTFFNPIFNETSLLETKAVFPHVEVITMFYAYDGSEVDDVSRATAFGFLNYPTWKKFMSYPRGLKFTKWMWLRQGRCIPIWPILTLIDSSLLF